MVRSAAIVTLYLLGLCVTPSWARVHASVMFDVSPIVACRDVTTDAFLMDHPGERLMQAEIEISAFISGNVASVVEAVYSLDAPERRVMVHDYLPKTTLVTDVVGNINVQRSSDSGVNAKLSLRGDVGEFAAGDASIGGNRKKSTSFRYEQLPPREMLSAAGTVRRGSGVYFKLKPSAQSSLEGARKFIVVLRVPSDWRADYLRAACHATTRDGHRIGNVSYIVPLHQMADESARQLGLQLGQEERTLLIQARQKQAMIRRASLPTVAHELSLRQPNIPDNWLHQTLVASAIAGPASYESRLPYSVQTAIVRYRNAKLAMQLIGPDLSTVASDEGRTQVRLKPIQPVNIVVRSAN